MAGLDFCVKGVLESTVPQKPTRMRGISRIPAFPALFPTNHKTLYLPLLSTPMNYEHPPDS